MLLLFFIRWGLNTLAFFSRSAAGHLTLSLLSTPRRKRIPFEVLDFLNTAEQHDLFFGDYPIRCYRWAGKKPAVLLAHGWESYAGRWQSTIQALQEKGHEVVALDAPAHGFSGGKHFTAALYARVIDKVAEYYQPRILIGHSAGGMAVVYLLTQIRPMPIEHLVLMATPAELSTIMNTFHDFLQLAPRVKAGFSKAFEEKYRMPVADFSIRQFVCQLEVKGLIIQDEEDPVTPYAEGLALHQSWAGSTLVTTHGLGHSLQSPEVIRTILDFLEPENKKG